MKRHKTTYPGLLHGQVARIGGSGLERVYYLIFNKDGKVFEEKVVLRTTYTPLKPRPSRIP